MQISVLMPHLKVYGGVRRIVEISNNWVDLGHKVDIYHTDGGGCDWLRCKFGIFSLAEFSKNKHDILLSVGDNYDLFTKVKANKKFTYLLGIYLLKKRSLWECLRVYGHGYRDYEYYRSDPTPRTIVYGGPHPKIVVSTWMRNWLRLNYGQDADVVHGGINQEMFYPANVRKESGKIKVLAFGRGKMWKDTETIIKAVDIVKKIDNRIFLELYDGKNVSQDEMAKEYSSADIFVNAELFGGWSNPTAEAMACGVPVITTDIGAVQDFAIDNVNALLVPRKSPGQVAEKIMSLVRNPPLREYLSENGAKTMKQFTWRKSACELLKIFGK